MIHRLEEDRGFTRALSVWTVDTWGLLLGTWTVADLEQFQVISGKPEKSQDKFQKLRQNTTINLPHLGGPLEFIAIPGGTLILEGGYHIKLHPFLLGKYPITQRQYQAIMEHNPARFQSHRDHLDCPVECVNWYKAIEFCQIVSQRLHCNIDLPSKTQWRWAAQGANSKQLYHYAGSHDLDTVGWYIGNAQGRTHAVGQKQPNELGLYDMSGNVWEWCRDNRAHSVYEFPQDGTPLMGGDFTRRGLRGGSWHDDAESCAVAYRYHSCPSFSSRYFGFRVALFNP
jgi:hypothetical protein